MAKLRPQGGPLKVTPWPWLYALAIAPFIRQLKDSCPEVCQAWYADGATGASSCTKLCQLWDELADRGPSFGYYSNASKTYLVVKEEILESAESAFAKKDGHITTNGKRHLGAALGSRTFTEEYVRDKVKGWTKDIMDLAKVAKSQPHAAYAAYVHGLSSC